jgi:ankyrin repeat protein
LQGGQTALHVACLKDKVQLGVIKALCSAKRLDARDNEGNTALHLLAKRGKLKTVKVLLERGALM